MSPIPETTTKGESVLTFVHIIRIINFYNRIQLFLYFYIFSNLLKQDLVSNVTIVATKKMIAAPE